MTDVSLQLREKINGLEPEKGVWDKSRELFFCVLGSQTASAKTCTKRQFDALNPVSQTIQSRNYPPDVVNFRQLNAFCPALFWIICE
ncbi:hypothetical protein CRI87_06085 [Liquorilactobacillus satsumensis]|nr:hypothetical protein [Liquorilactobacillus satsumensis]